MKKRFVVPAWVLLLTIVLVLAACGPATPPEDATPEADGAPVATEEGTGEETAVDEAPVGIPTVEGETTTTDSGLVYIETLAGDGRVLSARSYTFSEGYTLAPAGAGWVVTRLEVAEL